jgi:hypothetical protein
VIKIRINKKIGSEAYMESKGERGFGAVVRSIYIKSPILSHSAPQVQPKLLNHAGRNMLRRNSHTQFRPSQDDSTLAQYILSDILYTDRLIRYFSRNTLNYIATYNLSHIRL